MIFEFPPLETADPDGLLAVGGDLEVGSLKLAYSSGIFPWPRGKHELLWFAPPERSVLFLDKFRMPRSLHKEWKRAKYEFKINCNFEKVIRRCANIPRRGQNGTWITPGIIKAYCEFHQSGFCHSIECYKDKQLVAGLYCPSIGGMVAGESMFHEVANTSKLCLVFLAQYLKERGAKWIDFQVHKTDLVVSPLLKSLGAIAVPRQEFMSLLKQALHAPALFSTS